MNLLRVAALWKSYDRAEGPVHALRDVSFEVAEGAFTTITGPSGAGKTTLLLAMGGLLRATSGEIFFGSSAIHRMGDSELAAYRRDHLGFVMQSFSLIPYLTAVENVALPLGLQGLAIDERTVRARAAVEEVGLGARANHFPRELSAGQQQRVAIARAMVTRPDLILADEPTGNLDPGLARDILAALYDLNRSRGMTVVMVTHSPEAAAMGSTRLRMRDGAIVGADVSSE